jgi:hypothetical protein
MHGALNKLFFDQRFDSKKLSEWIAIFSSNANITTGWKWQSDTVN